MSLQAKKITSEATIVPRAAIDALGAGAGGRGRGLPSISTLSLPVGNVPITKLVRASRKRTAKNQEWAESNTHKSKAKVARRWLAARALREANHFYPPLVAPNTRTNYSSCGLVYVLGSLSQKGFGNSVATTISKKDSATTLRWRYLERSKRATLTPTSRRAVLPKTGLAPSLALLLVSPPLRPLPKRILTMTRTLGRMLKTSKPFAGIVPRSLAQNGLGNVASAKRTIVPRERSRPLRRRCPRSYASKSDLAIITTRPGSPVSTVPISLGGEFR